MKYFIVDDDPAIRSMLVNILETELGAEIGGMAEDGNQIHAKMLNDHQVDILMIDLLMPERDGIETLKAIHPDFRGKAVMLSQVETKDIIADAYQNKAEAYITKPVNRLEVISVLKRIEKSRRLEMSLDQIRNSLKLCPDEDSVWTDNDSNSSDATPCLSGQILSDLGIRHEKGAEDIQIIVKLLKDQHVISIPPLKELWKMATAVKTGEDIPSRKEIKATEQRVRRAIQQSFNHITSLGAMDMTHPKFEHYGMKFFDLDQIQSRINAITTDYSNQDRPLATRLNMKRFIAAFYDECRL
ncbi:two-component system, response regulator YcbB [Evansella caseinilytica]|uniref:Two-component system, response regulator YcbB n=1 Tax=Evansella caseinilytica TaxID=1503961 RepID=A0A1H3THG6_9BACI|nr:DNA-binding domain-containing protein [Evansella caseinilytica]SDZ49308.1 two-component system, response regulator YcbB [Evansella caseinilytica]